MGFQKAIVYLVIFAIILVIIVLVFQNSEAPLRFPEKQKGVKLFQPKQSIPGMVSTLLSKHGETLVVTGVQMDAAGTPMALVYAANGGILQTSLSPSKQTPGNPGISEQMPPGMTGSLSGDGKTLVLGIPSDNGGVGGVWVFKQQSGAGKWVEVTTALVGAGAEGAAGQGAAVSLSGDGGTLAVGGPLDNTTKAAVWIFGGSNLSQAQGSKLAGCGIAVSLSHDGNVLAATTPDFAVQIWRRSVDGKNNWTQRANVVGLGILPQDFFGDTIGLSGNGKMLVVSAPGRGTGTVMSFRTSDSDGSSNWKQVGGSLKVSGVLGTKPNIGSSVSMSEDGRVLAVGGSGDNGGVGATWVFTRERDEDHWSQRKKLVGSGEVGVGAQGSSLGLSGNGKKLAVTGPLDNNKVGATWLFGH
jgi:hypothetical protein